MISYLILSPSHLKLLALGTPESCVSVGHDKGQSLHETTMEEKLKTGFLLTPDSDSIFKRMHT